VVEQEKYVKGERYFEIASEEIKSGMIRPGLRAKAIAEANGDEGRAQR
jgi:hypothetical protein